MALAGAVRGELGLAADFLRRARLGSELARVQQRYRALLDGRAEPSLAPSASR